MVNRRVFEEGDKVLVVHEKQDYYYISEYVRSGTLGWLFALFVAVVIFVAGWVIVHWREWFFICCFTEVGFAVDYKWYVACDCGDTGAVIIIPMTFYSSHGINRKTTVAILVH
jgi:uncharacterized membrane protein